ASNRDRHSFPTRRSSDLAWTPPPHVGAACRSCKDTQRPPRLPHAGEAPCSRPRPQGQVSQPAPPAHVPERRTPCWPPPTAAPAKIGRAPCRERGRLPRSDVAET